MSQAEAIAVDPPVHQAKLPTLQAGGRPQAIIPQSFDDAYRIAQVLAASKMVPEGLELPEQIVVVIMHGAEVGLAPMQALQSIAMIRGRPSIWGDGAMGLVRGSGLLEWAREQINGEGDEMIAVCAVQRRGEPDSVTRTFSVADAKLAGLWGKGITWSTYPKRMLQMRARSLALRDVFADVLRGLYITEESMDIPPSAAEILPPAPPPEEDAEIDAIAIKSGVDLGSPIGVAHLEGEDVTVIDLQNDVSKNAGPFTMEPPDTHEPEALLKWIEKVCESATNIEELELLWGDNVDFLIEDFSVEHRETAYGIYHKYEKLFE